MKKRLTFQCWHCNREYSLTREVEGQPRLLVECPYCEKEGVVDLAPFRSEAVEIFKSVDPPRARAGQNLTLPEVIPTVQPEE